MIAFDLAFELTLGAACASWERARLVARGGTCVCSRFSDGLMLSALVYVLWCSAGLAAWPGWQAMYLVDLDAGGAALAIAAGISSAALAGAYVVGFAGAARLLRGGVSQRVIALSFGSFWLVLLGVLFGALWERAFTVTSYAAFHAGVSASLAWGAPNALLGGPVTAFLAASTLVNGAGVAVVYARARPKE